MDKKVVRVLFNGDSTTDVGRARPIGDGFGKMGDSYLANIFCMTWADHPDNNIRYFNAAVSGDTTTKLLARFDEDVTPYEPDYVFFLIGINDCWRRYDCPLTPSSATTPEQYRKNMQTCIDKTKAIGAIPTLISPFFFELNKLIYNHIIFFYPQTIGKVVIKDCAFVCAIFYKADIVFILKASTYSVDVSVIAKRL